MKLSFLLAHSSFLCCGHLSSLPGPHPAPRSWSWWPLIHSWGEDRQVHQQNCYQGGREEVGHRNRSQSRAVYTVGLEGVFLLVLPDTPWGWGGEIQAPTQLFVQEGGMGWMQN